MKKIVNILIHPFYSEESSKFLDVYNNQLEQGTLNIIFYPQVDKRLKRAIVKKNLKDFKAAFNSLKDKSDLDKVYDKKDIYKYLFNLHHTALIMRQVYFGRFFRHIKRKNHTVKARKVNRKRSSKVLNRFINKIDCCKPILKLSQKVTVFKDDVIFKYSTEARKYLEDKFIEKTLHIDGGSFLTINGTMKHFKKTLGDTSKVYDVKVFGEYRNQCVSHLEDILKKNEIEYDVIDSLCTFNATNGRELDKEDYFYIKKGSEDE